MTTMEQLDKKAKDTQREQLKKMNKGQEEFARKMKPKLNDVRSAKDTTKKNE